MSSPNHRQPPVKDRVGTNPGELEEVDGSESADGDEQRVESTDAGRSFHYAYHQQWPEMPSNTSGLVSVEGGTLVSSWCFE